MLSQKFKLEKYIYFLHVHTTRFTLYLVTGYLGLATDPSNLQNPVNLYFFSPSEKRYIKTVKIENKYSAVETTPAEQTPRIE